ncbi:hypothetical protein NBO_285g0002 [Nosema bombycis CQ1]|uniref:Uncharacterized protein n=1 Tax=Nosema bombycis (strain CQ1 / CVCC 102059) TaxID=578461 RepID=R0KQH3_NOSB1|nr:hypothetical protein NBO_285g0002 [Nosema bombycis CQ1]|eukprot:EOB12971.1 hypothetical protein NBO_285g0002 [Nosema bombycis CQ1]
MTRKKYFNNKNQCQKLPDLDRLEKRPVVSKNIKIESKYLLSFNEHIFSATETLVVNVIKLNIAYYKKYKAQSNLILYKECATLKKEFMTVLKKFRIDQITYTNLQKRDSFKLMAIQSLKTFDKFLHRTFSILKGILNRCYYMEHQLDNFSEKKKITFLYNESICLEIRKYANALHYHFTNIDFEIKTYKYFNEKLNNITIDVQSFYDKAMSKFIYPNNAWNDKLKSESLIIYDENVEPHDDIEIQKYQQNDSLII